MTKLDILEQEVRIIKATLDCLCGLNGRAKVDAEELQNYIINRLCELHQIRAIINKAENIKTSDLIEKLNKSLQENGDLDVVLSSRLNTNCSIVFKGVTSSAFYLTTNDSIDDIIARNRYLDNERKTL